MRRFDYGFLKCQLTGDMVGLAEIVADLRAREEFRKLQYPEAFEALRIEAVIASVKGSNAIEGIVTSDFRIRDLVAGAAPLGHDEQEISGYKDALNQIHSHYATMDVDEETILRLHRMVEEQSAPQEAGHYKSRNNFIMEYGPDGSRRVRFKPVPAGDTGEAMQQLLLAYYEARQDSDISPLLLIPCVVLDFLCIHPFMDGNGRISRLLTVLLLYISGYDIVRYISYEEQVNKYKAGYYNSLKRASLGWDENRNDYVPVIVYFLQILYRSYKDLDGAFAGTSLKKAKKSERVELLLLESLVPVSKAEILHRLPDVSAKTVEAVLSRLLKDGRLVKIGSYRDARYMKNHRQ